MLKYFACLCLLVFLVAMNACTKVIRLNLRTAPPVYVIEGNITDQPGPYTVQVFQTTGFYSPNSFPGVTGASVTIADGEGHSEVLTDKGGGNYVTKSLQGVQGTTYALSVVIGKDTFSAVSTMPQRINFDSLYVSPVYNGGKTVLVSVPVFLNPPGPGLAYYFFNQTIDGYLDKSLYYWNSGYSEGLANAFNLERSDPDSTLHQGDTVTIEMQCIDLAMYNYWIGMDQSATGSGAAYPGNPVTNLTGGALGYFSAHTSQTRGVRVH